MTPAEQADAILAAAAALVADIKAAYGSLTMADARALIPTIREAEDWLAGARKLLDPTWAIDEGGTT